MKVLHLPLEVAGQVGEICKQLRAQGVTAVGYNWRHNYLQYGHQILHSDAYEMINTLETASEYFDLFHYHTGYTLFQDKADIRMLAETGKPIVMHHRGNDVRLASRAVNGKFGHNPHVYTGDSQPEEQIIRNLELYADLVSAAIVQDIELYDYVVDYYPEVHILPRVFDMTRMITPPRPNRRRKPLVVHAPTSRAFKGSEFIEQTVAQLQREMSFDFLLVEQKSMAETREIFAAADVIIDQILCGMYGNVSVEGMGYGKTVICYIRPDIQAKLPLDLPIVSANPDTLYDVLKQVLNDPEHRWKLGKQGNAYVRKVHDSKKVVRQLVRIYQTILRKIVR